jgi:hypothetical protein
MIITGIHSQEWKEKDMEKTRGMAERNTRKEEGGRRKENSLDTESVLDGNLIPHSTFHFPQSNPRPKGSMPPMKL